MSEWVKAIELVFENIDYVTIPVSFIEAINIQGISSSISFFCTNTIHKNQTAHSVYLKINHDFKCDMDEADEGNNIYEEFDKRIFECDIAYLRIHYTDDSTEDIYVPWEDKDDKFWKNRFQRVYKDNKGNYIVQIRRGKK